eukprot:7421220-Pyramimonas_sp.AAC.1
MALATAGGVALNCSMAPTRRSARSSTNLAISSFASGHGKIWSKMGHNTTFRKRSAYFEPAGKPTQ